jgi:hypothetical protein
MPKAQDYSSQHKRKNSLFYAVAVFCVVVLPVVWVVISWIKRSSEDTEKLATETAVVSNFRAYSAAQELFRRFHGSNVEFARRLSGTNSLLESQPGLCDRKLIPKALGDAEEYPGMAQPAQGYLFRILTGRTIKEKPGKQIFFDNSNRLSLGHALLGYPVRYGNESRFVYMVGPDGVIYQKDFGAATSFAVQKLQLYGPDESWKKVF